ncbi:MAG: HIT family protein [Kiritimatiellae bacterium]|nr:HIT family protein [Kiritimatiellia bacterium]MBQ9345315.1 HIT family protein [Kiritimatiellia bacterium]
MNTPDSVPAPAAPADCLFCKIASGAIPSAKVFEDDQCLVFMDIGPLTHGHALVIPKQHVRAITEAPLDLASHLLDIAQRVARAQVAALGAKGVNIVTNDGELAGQTVPHLHFHVIPQYPDDQHVWNWEPHPYADPVHAPVLAAALAGAMP